MNENSSTEAIKAGLVVGFVGIAITLLSYLVSPDFMLGWSGFITFLTTITILVVFGRKFRDAALEGFIKFGTAFKILFIAAICASVLSGFFAIVLYNYIDTSLSEKLIEEGLKSAEQVLELIGTPLDKIDEEMTKAELELPYKFTPMGMLSDSWAWLLGAAFNAAIAALFVKKSKPDFELE